MPVIEFFLLLIYLENITGIFVTVVLLQIFKSRQLKYLVNVFPPSTYLYLMASDLIRV